jgi:Zn-dependent metalloprotease
MEDILTNTSHHSTGPICSCCFALPPYLTDHLRKHARDKRVRQSLALMHEESQLQRLVRKAALSMRRRAPGATAAPRLERHVYDCERTTDLLKRLARKEGGRKTKDLAVNEAYDHSGTVFRFFEKVFRRASIDNENLPLISSVHYQELEGVGYDNAFWNGRQMVYGDGDGVLFNRFTIARDVVGHELTHGVTQYEAALKYERQSGALNEHFSDVFGVLARQWADGDGDPLAADWSIGKGLFKPSRLRKMSLRSMSAPGTAYDDPELGRDPQPDHMSGYKDLPNTELGDWGGVHVNSGIPNHAFYRAAAAIGKPAWEVAGKIWYIALCDRLRDNADFRKCAYETISVARDFYDRATAQKIQAAWLEVGVISSQQRLVA